MKTKIDKNNNKNNTGIEPKGITLTGHIHFVHKDELGNVKDEREIRNLVVNAGKAEVAALIGAVAGGTAFGYIAIGTGTNAAAAGDTALQTEITTGGGERGNSTESVVETYKTQFTYTFTFTAPFAITESGIFNAASSGDMLARQVFSAINVISGDSLACTWKITVG